MLEENKAVIRRFVEEAFNRGNLDIADEVYAPRFFSYGTPEGEFGPENVKRFVNMYRAAFPDGRTTIEDMIAEGDKVAYRWTYRGTHQGELMGIAPTGREVTITGITISRFADGKIVEEWNNFDQLGTMQQLGVIPAPGQPYG
ncbi:MAG TPA: ester cyclase [Rubrobacteraceae bacterium]|nr:ester cyclase [Rubrobacteraceae bacterium]